MKSSELENLRLHKLSLENFRCFRKAEIDLSADVVAIYGRNGTGKTAIFDALEFALIGAIRRFEDENDPPGYVQNVFSEEGASARVDFNHGSLWVKVTGDQVFQAGVELDGSSKWVNRRDFVYEALANEDYFPPRRELSFCGPV